MQEGNDSLQEIRRFLSKLWPNMHEFFNLLLQQLSDRCFFITTTGWLGIGGPDVAGGDELWLVKGYPVPVLLRRSQTSRERWVWVGDTIVKGIMRGELVSGVYDEEFERVEIE